MLSKIYDIVSHFLDGERVNVNYLNESEPSYSINPVSDVKVREYLGDMELRKFTFEIWSIDFYGDDAGINIVSLDKMNALSKKLEEYEDDTYPFFAIDLDVPPVLEKGAVSMARYKMRMSVTYAV